MKGNVKVIDMLTKKEINKIRTMYYEQNYTVTEIKRIMNISRQTIYTYLKFCDFSEDIQKKSRNTKMAKYKDDIIGFLEEDKIHHHKQRHSGKRIFERLKEKYPDFDLGFYTVMRYYRTLKQEFFYKHNGFLPLEHKPGCAQVDFGDASFIEGGVKYNGKYLVLTFPHSNASYIQLIKKKNSESAALAMINIFEYLGGVPHTIWFDNDVVFVQIDNLPNGSIKRTPTDTFNRFQLHYEFKEVFLNTQRGNEKGTVEQGVRFMRRNLLVPVPNFNNLEEYNKDLLDRCKELLKREHYVLKQPIVDLHFDDINELNQLPPTKFICQSIIKRKLDNYGRLTTAHRHYYYLNPSYAYKHVQIKLLPNEMEFYTEEGEYLMTTPRISGNPGARYINWSPYIRLLADKPAAMYNFSFLDLFEGNNTLIERITKLDGLKLKVFLTSFANMIDEKGIDEAINNVVTLLD